MINWKLRLKNKATLVSLGANAIALVYMILSMFGIAPPICESEVNAMFGLVVTILCTLGIVVDPTTEGIGDSEQALDYDEPRRDGE